MRVLTINFQSLKNKKEELNTLIETAKPDVIIGTETWLNSTIYSSEFFPSYFDVIRKDRLDGYGGVLMAIRKDLEHYPILKPEHVEQVFPKIHFGQNNDLLIGAFYRPPNSDLQYVNDMCSSIESTCHEQRNTVTWIGGDFNLPDINWTYLTVDGNRNISQINNRLLDMALNFGLQQMVTFHTREKSTLDSFLTNQPSLVT